MPAEGAMARLDPRSLRLYVVTSGTSVSGRTHRAIASAAVKGGATAVQLRGPELGDDELMPLAASLVETCAEAGIPLLVNDRIEVAVSSGASGAHVGQDDDPATARGRLGPERDPRRERAERGGRVGRRDGGRRLSRCHGVGHRRPSRKRFPSGWTDSETSPPRRRSPWSGSEGSTSATRERYWRRGRQASR